MIKITKFGGSSCASAEQFRKVKDIIEADPARRFVVVSAAGRRFKKDNKLTDLLYLCEAHLKYHVDHLPLFNMIADRFLEIKREIGVNTPIEAELDAMRKALPNMSTDEIVSRGEYFTARLMADYLGFAFVDAKDVVAINFDGTFNLEESERRVNEILKTTKKFVMPGFYGRLPDGSIRLMSRGGSDISGSILARCLDADEYENWTDVSGFLMADPRIIENPRGIESITFSELRELSYMGAGVLHEDVVFPLREKDIPIRVKNTNQPDDPGTIVRDTIAPDPEGQLVTGIAGRKDFIAIEISKKNMSNRVGFIREVLSILETYGVSVEHIPSGIDSFSVVVNREDVKQNIHEIIAKIKTTMDPDVIRLTDPFALIATVGRNMNSRPGTSAKLFTALGNAGINIRMIAQGSAELNIIVGVANCDFDRAIKCLYDTFNADAIEAATRHTNQATNH